MTTAEQKSIELLNEQLRIMREENHKFRSSMSELVAAINNKVEAKHAPISMEQEILSTVQSAMAKAIDDTLKGYNSPLGKLIQSVVESRSSQLREIVTSAFDHVIGLQEFKDSIIAAFSHKVAKSIISAKDGLFDKVANELKQDVIFKSKMSIAVSNVVEECLRNKA